MNVGLSAIVIPSILNRMLVETELLTAIGFEAVMRTVLWDLVLILLAWAVAPNLFRAERGSRRPCSRNLEIIEAAQSIWYLETQSTDRTPAVKDLFGREKTLAMMPVCPQGATRSAGTRYGFGARFQTMCFLHRSNQCVICPLAPRSYLLLTTDD